MQGMLLVDKPAGWTSFDVVNYVRKMARQAALVEMYKVESQKSAVALDFETFRHSTPLPKVKVGHTGTLDPFATGLLVLLIGKDYTKRAGELSKLDKTYEVTMRLGETSTTGDPEGTVTPYQSASPNTLTVISNESEKSRQAPGILPRSFARAQDDSKRPNLEEVKAAVAQFVGEIEQVPPAFSAIKVNGQRAYKLARAGKEVVIEPRKVTINRLEITEYNYPEVKLIADVSSGTYIRTLVEDLGKALRTGAYTTALRRTCIGKQKLADATEI